MVDVNAGSALDNAVRDAFRCAQQPPLPSMVALLIFRSQPAQLVLTHHVDDRLVVYGTQGNNIIRVVDSEQRPLYNYLDVNRCWFGHEDQTS